MHHKLKYLLERTATFSFLVGFLTLPLPKHPEMIPNTPFPPSSARRKTQTLFSSPYPCSSLPAFPPTPGKCRKPSGKLRQSSLCCWAELRTDLRASWDSPTSYQTGIYCLFLQNSWISLFQPDTQCWVWYPKAAQGHPDSSSTK